MLPRHTFCTITSTLIAWMFASSAVGQPFITTIDFESILEGEEAVFQEPEFSGTTTGILTGTDIDGFPISGVQTVVFSPMEDRAYEIRFPWADPTSTNGTEGVRCTTAGADNLASPSVHLAGKIRFNIAVTSFEFLGTNGAPVFGDQVTDGSAAIYVALAIRETGHDLPQGSTDTGGGDLEFIYPTKIGGVAASTAGIPQVGSNGLISFPPAGLRVEANTTWPPLNSEFVELEFDLAEISSNGLLRGFANNLDGTDTAGDGVLDATLNPNGNGVNRGTLESIIFSKDPSDTNPSGGYFFIYVDDIEYESPVEDPTPPPSIVAPILRNDLTVTVENISTNATQVRLIVDNGSDPDIMMNPAGATSFIFSLPHPAIAGDVYTATQTVDGKESVPSIAVPVSFPGPVVGLLPKDGDTSVRVTDIDPNATAVEIFVNDISRGTTATTNGVFTVDAAAGAALIMGEVVTATQVVDGASSDSSPIAIVTTNGFTTVFCDDFEYANQSAFDANWLPNTGDQQLVLSSTRNATPGGSKSAYSDTSGSGVNANQSVLAVEFGNTVGTNTHPIIWNLSYFDGLANSGLYRQYAELRASGLTTPLIALGKTNQIVGNFHSGRLVSGADWITLGNFGQPQRTNGWHVLTAVIKSNNVDFYVDGTVAALNVSFTASAALATAVIGPGLSSAGGEAYFDDLCVDVGSVHFNSITAQPPESPTVVAPIVPNATSVMVIDIDTNATAVTLLRNGTPIDTQDPAGLDNFTFTIAPAVGGHQYTAQQTVGGLTSPESAAVTVLLPGPTLYKAPAIGETSVRVLNVDTNASMVEVKVNDIVRGSANPAGGADVVVSLTAFSLTTGEVVTAKMTVGGIESVDSAPETVTTSVAGAIIWCDDFEGYGNQAAFNAVYSDPPGGSQLVLSSSANATVGGSQSGQALATGAHRSKPPAQVGAAGTDTNPIVWSINIFDDTGGGGVNQWADLNNVLSDFFLAEMGIAVPGFTGSDETHYHARLVGNGAPAGDNNGWFELDEFDGPPRSAGWHTFTMVFKGPAPGNAAGHEVDVYVDELLAAKNVVLTESTTLREPRIGSGQTPGAAAFYDDYCAQAGPVTFPTLESQPPARPTIVAPVEHGDTLVTVEGIGPDAIDVTVYANGSPIGSLVGAGTNGIVTINVTALEHLDAITADQTNLSGTSPLSDPVEVGIGSGAVLISLGIRETGGALPLGSEGATTGPIEWIGADATSNGAPQGKAIVPSGKWQTILFDAAGDLGPPDPVTGFTGNGVIDVARGTLEHLAVSVNAAAADRSSGAYTLYVDNVININADGGGDFVVADFEANSNGQEVLFQEPTNSGSTFPAQLLPLPSSSEVSSEQANGGIHSLLLRWFWKDTTDQRWARITTSAANFTSRPVIDLTQPIQLDVLLAPTCTSSFGDLDGNGVVNDADVQAIMACVEGPAVGFDVNCECADSDGDLRVDLIDFAALQELIGG